MEANFHIGNEATLAEFRTTWTGGRILDQLNDLGGKMCVTWAVGVGKSVNIDQVIAVTIEEKRYDLVIALFPTRRLIDERAWIKQPPSNYKIVNLKPRPQEDCGPERDATWQHLASRGLGALGRNAVCGKCPHHETCPWPSQLGFALDGTQVIFGAQAHLDCNPSFVQQCMTWVGAKRVLLILDEDNFILKNQGREITRQALEQFCEVLAELESSIQSDDHRQWLYLCQTLQTCQKTEDLRTPDWFFPWFDSTWAYAVQALGWRKFGEQFRFLGFELRLFGQSAMDSRERDYHGNLKFSVSIGLSSDVIVYSASTQLDLLQFRLGQAFPSPFQDYRFNHSETVWYNLASRIGMLSYYNRNAPQILDFFAQLIAVRLREGRRILCIAKKSLQRVCAEQLQARLGALGCSDCRVIAVVDGSESVEATNVVPIISFGAIGTNSFEAFDCAYCLTGYYVNEEVLSTTVQSLRASDFHIPLKISTQGNSLGNPPRRVATVRDAKDRVYDINALVQPALDYLESGTVLQAIGRVRPYTRPREIITFQCASHPTGDYTEEFSNLQQMRDYFGLLDKRQAKSSALAENIRALKARGISKASIASELQVSKRTVDRYWQAFATPTL